MAADDSWADETTRRLHRSATASSAHAYSLYLLVDDRVYDARLPASGTFTIGRHRSADLRVEHQSISRHHARVHVDAGLFIEDLGSMNGTRLRGQPLVAGARLPLTPGEVFELGDVLALVRSSADDAMKAGAVTAFAKPRGLIAEDPALLAVYRVAASIAPSHLSVLLLGETGAGKEVLARYIHTASPRASGPYVALNCAAFPESLLESELFGHEPGAFTGANKRKLGLLESASKGTVFLDEIGDMPLATQAKMLRVIESGVVLPLGALEPRRIDVRFVAATHRDLRAAIKVGAFREDLYYRLDGISLRIPPLRERPADIEPLTRFFIATARERIGASALPVSAEALHLLHAHTWPGNVRELRNVVERAVVMANGQPIEAKDIVLSSDAVAPPVAPTLPGTETLDEATRIIAALNTCAGNQTAAATLLGMSRSTLVRRISQLGLPRPRVR